MEREFLVRGGNVVTLAVKPVLADRLYVCGRDGPEMTVRGSPDAIPRGAVLWCSAARGGGPLRARAFDGGLYDALRALAGHVGDGYEAELAELEADPARLREAPDRPVEIDRIRGHVERRGWELSSFASSLFEALRSWYAVIRAAAASPEGADERLAEASRFLRGVSVAPLSRRALPNAAVDVDAAVADIRAGRATLAAARLSMAERSLRMTFVRRPLESALAVMSRHAARGTEPDRDERARLAAAVARGRGMLFEKGKPLDAQFRRPVIIPAVVPRLTRVARLLAADGPLDLALARAEFSAGLAPL